MGHTCSECHSTFKHFRSLIRHKKTHKTHEIKTYKCQQCPSSFTRRDNLQRHISDHHPIPPPTKKIRKIEPEPSKPTTRPSVIVANSNPHPPPQPFKRPWQDVQPPPQPIKRPWEDTQPSTPIDEPSRVVPNPLYASPPSLLLDLQIQLLKLMDLYLIHFTRLHPPQLLGLVGLPEHLFNVKGVQDTSITKPTSTDTSVKFMEVLNATNAKHAPSPPTTSSH